MGAAGGLEFGTYYAAFFGLFLLCLCNFTISIARGTVDSGEELFRKHLEGCLLEIRRTKALHCFTFVSYLGLMVLFGSTFPSYNYSLSCIIIYR